MPCVKLHDSDLTAMSAAAELTSDGCHLARPQPDQVAHAQPVTARRTGVRFSVTKRVFRLVAPVDAV